MPSRLLLYLRLIHLCGLIASINPIQAWAQATNAEHYLLALPDSEQLASIDTLMVHGDFVDIRISPSDGNSRILWTAQFRPEENRDSDLARIEAPILGPTLSVSESKLIIRAESDQYRYSLDIQLPALQQYQLRIYGEGYIETVGIEGELTAWSSRGHIDVREQAGRVSLTAMDGVARVQFLDDALLGSSAITMNYGVEKDSTLNIALPESARSTIRVQTSSAIYSDIPSLKSELPAAVKVDFSDYLEIKLNGGGPTLILRNLNGDVRLLRALPN